MKIHQAYRVLNSAVVTGRERDAHAALKMRPRVLWLAFSHGWHENIVLSEFRFGTEFRADFLLLSAHSGAWHATFIELEPPSARLYLKDGTESVLLRRALRQVKDWANWLRKNDSSFRQDLRRALEEAAKKDRDIETNPSNYSGNHLLDPRTVVCDHYVIVIGRRQQLTPMDQERRSTESIHTQGLEIATYDRLLDLARKDDGRLRKRVEGQG
jgi:Shedu protein SduA, C-terminal